MSGCSERRCGRRRLHRHYGDGERALTDTWHVRIILSSSTVVGVRCAGGKARVEVRRLVVSS